MESRTPAPATTRVASRPTGDSGSYEELVIPLLDAGYRTALRLTRNAADAEDLLQEAALKAYRGFGSFTQGSNSRAWFFRILTNTFYSQYRKRRRQGTTVELEDTPELYLFNRTAAVGLHARTADPAESLLERLDAEAVERAVDALPDEYRVVATLYFMQDCSYQEIAEILDVPIGTVRSRLHRGRRLLQKSLWTIAEESGVVAELVGRAGQP